MKEPVEILLLDRYMIKFYDETDYIYGSADNSITYDKTFISGEQNRSIHRIGIGLFEDEKQVVSCLIGSEGGGTGINANSILISNGGFVICCSNTVFKLTIPDLNLEWKTIADRATCFSIYHLDADYVVHGEFEISRLDKNGKIIWQQAGRDIWTTAEGIDDFVVYDDHIIATDWDYYRYKFDFNGKVLEEYKVKPTQTTQIFEKQAKKKWWKIW